MKAKPKEQPASVTERLDDFIAQIKAKKKALDKNASAARTAWTAIDRLLRRHQAVFGHGEDFEVILKRCSSKVIGRDAQDLAELVATWRAACNAIDILAAEKKGLEASLRELMAREGGARDAALLAAHGALVERAAAAILPFCQDAREAEAVARGLNIHTRVHLRIHAWNRHELLNNAETLLHELQRQVPTV